MIVPPFLQKGDAVGLVAPARKVTEKELLPAVEIIKKRGYRVVMSRNLLASENQFAGNDILRAADFQEILDNPEIKAIFAVRGGYGCVRIVDLIDFRRFLKNPKWLVGYSDFTVFLNHVLNMGVRSLHATMPLNFAENSAEALNTLFSALEGKKLKYFWTSRSFCRNGTATGILAGGNLSVLYSLLGSRSFPDLTGKILFLEDLDEYLYHLDRMMMAFKRAGVLKDLAGLIVGGMTQMHDNTIPFGKTAEEIIIETVNDYNFPVAFHFPAGHFADNRTLIMGAEVHWTVTDKKNELSF